MFVFLQIPFVGLLIYHPKFYLTSPCVNDSLHYKYRSITTVPTNSTSFLGGGKMAEGYCVKCKAKREIADAQEVTMKNGRPALKGKCPTCGTGMYKILSKKKCCGGS